MASTFGTPNADAGFTAALIEIVNEHQDKVAPPVLRAVVKSFYQEEMLDEGDRVTTEAISWANAVSLLIEREGDPDGITDFSQYLENAYDEFKSALRKVEGRAAKEAEADEALAETLGAGPNPIFVMWHHSDDNGDSIFQLFPEDHGEEAKELVEAIADGWAGRTSGTLRQHRVGFGFTWAHNELDYTTSIWIRNAQEVL